MMFTIDYKCMGLWEDSHFNNVKCIFSIAKSFKDFFTKQNEFVYIQVKMHLYDMIELLTRNNVGNCRDQKTIPSRT